ncbi:MAG: CPBP family intramembrane metalloprotease [Gammaproteobacteria bacterium]|nr:CPBP family intramembrane metalloprotease [Gammaproteobacteria bacterium]
MRISDSRHVRMTLTLLWSASLIVLVYLLFNPFNRLPQLEQLHYAGESAGRMMDRHLEFYAGYEKVGDLERHLHSFLFGERSKVEDDAVATFREVLEFFQANPEHTTPWSRLNTRSRLMVTLGETGRLEELRKLLDDVGDNPEQEVIGSAIRFAYLEDRTVNKSEVMYGARMMPLGWASDRLWIRIAEINNDPIVRDFVMKRHLENGARLRQDVLNLAMTVMTVIIVGLFMMFRFGVLHMPPWPNTLSSRTWTPREGYDVAIRSAVLGLLIVIGLQLFASHFFRPGLLASWSTLFASLPMIWLIRQRLLIPRDTSLRKAFGLTLCDVGWRRFIMITLSFLAIEWLGIAIIGWLGWSMGIAAHWAEGVNERLIFGPTETLWLGVINLVVFTAIFEELGFRGLIYTSLRGRLSVVWAIPISALIFSSLHLYSLTGFLSVFWSGLVLAYVYERYRSLLPGMVIHAAGNLLSFGTVVLFYT